MSEPVTLRIPLAHWPKLVRVWEDKNPVGRKRRVRQWAHVYTYEGQTVSILTDETGRPAEDDIHDDAKGVYIEALLVKYRQRDPWEIVYGQA